MKEKVIENYLQDTVRSLRSYKAMAERALAQVTDDEFFCAIEAEANSLAVLVKHIAGNQRSRWRDFLTSDGEKAGRNRDTEFEITGDTRESLMELWETGWQTLFEALEPLKPEDFERSVTIRGEPHTICEAINRQLTHYAYHIGQITFLAKHFRSGEWQTLSVPRNRSAQFNAFLAEKNARGDGKSHPLEAPGEFAENERKA